MPTYMVYNAAKVPQGFFWAIDQGDADFLAAYLYDHVPDGQADEYEHEDEDEHETPATEEPPPPPPRKKEVFTPGQAVRFIGDFFCYCSGTILKVNTYEAVIRYKPPGKGGSIKITVRLDWLHPDY